VVPRGVNQYLLRMTKEKEVMSRKRYMLTSVDVQECRSPAMQYPHPTEQLQSNKIYLDPTENSLYKQRTAMRKSHCKQSDIHIGYHEKLTRAKTPPIASPDTVGELGPEITARQKSDKTWEFSEKTGRHQKLVQPTNSSTDVVRSCDRSATEVNMCH